MQRMWETQEWHQVLVTCRSVDMGRLCNWNNNWNVVLDQVYDHLDTNYLAIFLIFLHQCGSWWDTLKYRFNQGEGAVWYKRIQF